MPSGRDARVEEGGAHGVDSGAAGRVFDKVGRGDGGEVRGGFGIGVPRGGGGGAEDPGLERYGGGGGARLGSSGAGLAGSSSGGFGDGRLGRGA